MPSLSFQYPVGTQALHDDACTQTQSRACPPVLSPSAPLFLPYLSTSGPLAYEDYLDP